MNFRIEYTKTTNIRTGKKKVSILGKIVAVTGSLPGMNRSQAEWWITNKKQAAYATKVDRRVSYLIVGTSKKPKPSSKIAAATKYGVPMIHFNEIA